MVQHWPDSVVKRTYDFLSNLWKEKHIPTCVKWRWLALIPKIPGSDKLTDMRPISLLEIMRKLWNAFFARKVAKFLRAQSIPHPSQHAYWARSGTDAASLEVTNALEMVLEVEGTAGASSFDFRRAFDSASKNISKIALLRYGLPATLASYFVDQDIEGMTFIRSDLLLRLLARLEKLAAAKGVAVTDESLRDHPFFKFAFEALRGICQGGGRELHNLECDYGHPPHCNRPGRGGLPRTAL